jgi:hypothetical protein
MKRGTAMAIPESEELNIPESEELSIPEIKFNIPECEELSIPEIEPYQERKSPERLQK